MSSFPTGVKDGDLESKVLDILEETDAEVDQKIMIKLNRRKSIYKLLVNKKNLKLWSIHKKLWSAGHISLFRVSNGSP